MNARTAPCSQENATTVEPTTSDTCFFVIWEVVFLDARNHPQYATIVLTAGTQKEADSLLKEHRMQREYPCVYQGSFAAVLRVCSRNCPGEWFSWYSMKPQFQTMKKPKSQFNQVQLSPKRFHELSNNLGGFPPKDLNWEPVLLNFADRIYGAGRVRNSEIQYAQFVDKSNRSSKSWFPWSKLGANVPSRAAVVSGGCWKVSIQEQSWNCSLPADTLGLGFCMAMKVQRHNLLQSLMVRWCADIVCLCDGVAMCWCAEWLTSTLSLSDYCFCACLCEKSLGLGFLAVFKFLEAPASTSAHGNINTSAHQQISTPYQHTHPHIMLTINASAQHVQYVRPVIVSTPTFAILARKHVKLKCSRTGCGL
jgi:hypothetical protein